MNAVQNYIALDLELNNAPDNSTPNPKIIQVGVAIGSWDHYEDDAIITRKWYLDPEAVSYTHLTLPTNREV